MKKQSLKIFLLFVILQTIFSFVVMDINGPFFLMEERKYYNPTDIFVILSWNRNSPGFKLLHFAVNLPFILLFNTLTLKCYYLLRKRNLFKYDFLSRIASVIIIYLAIIPIWYFMFRLSFRFHSLLHPLAVLVGVGFLISNLIFYTIWFFFMYLKRNRTKYRR